ncbi:O-6-methylguanine DNA methyltransferase [Sphingomonas leidyi]|uniref:methylated-DNA--[protein]-cysteine S-methyltransferase n=1 Tax=Sphingomonas leidyi TaxID=68569 RepID=A0A7X5ZVB6_9SPHN|nr:methylated-DNA--[protein]-cysteine S-methyltransferase [Sphingomonas leidyi]NIJ64243.1 O-6-methylguanine DNA methyltransferase [Sphingomonas leidyi]
MNLTTNKSPARFAARGARADGGIDKISFGMGDSAIGRMLVARSADGVCTILFGDDDEQLAADLKGRFPGATLVRDDAAVATDLARLVRFVERPVEGLALPLDLRGTPFQQRVWDVLRGIPSGSTVTYAEVARRIGVPNAVRAVAGACAANPVALAIPCHRVVRSDGSLGGYRWGLDRKRTLIAREAMA